MTDLTQYLLSNTDETADFTSTSRYAGAPLKVMTDSSGRERVFVSRRFVPQPAENGAGPMLLVREGDRLDLLGAAYYADASAWWHIVDANLIDYPQDLVATPGRKIALSTGNGEG
ncbi:LysM domain-containing protein [Enterovibrio sp. ZSDZ35]|uniref:LysM domain-containing protein n=1 Tax=Enterovibrio qingdaonensis TaxID=2899818 RepID=A0ABT5QHM2_9GAMM|nr:LysM domain-containing protein [Enterovibrio sp. ZSDZ35]MDD1780472.1 LysM domain-containing protein [Enterovibrio sp. ZSDZ35]